MRQKGVGFPTAAEIHGCMTAVSTVAVDRALDLAVWRRVANSRLISTSRLMSVVLLHFVRLCYGLVLWVRHGSHNFWVSPVWPEATSDMGKFRAGRFLRGAKNHARTLVLKNADLQECCTLRSQDQFVYATCELHSNMCALFMLRKRLTGCMFGQELRVLSCFGNSYGLTTGKRVFFQTHRDRDRKHTARLAGRNVLFF